MEEYMKKRFNELISERIANKGKNNQLFTKHQYMSLIEKIKASKIATTKKTPEDYQRLARYDVIKIGTLEKLIVPLKSQSDPIIYYVHLDETIQVIHDCHIRVGHGGRTRMMKELKLKYKNITAELVTIYLNLCKSCQKKKRLPKKELVGKRILSEDINSRCQADVVDMQSRADGDYNFIMVYQDHQTKFVQLRPLKTKQAKEVAYHLIDIFTIFGAPSILQSDNGREFAHKVVKEVCEMWPELKFVHGKTPESVGRANQDIEKMLSTWLESKKKTKWAEELRFVQFMKNRAHHAEIDRSPYEAMFGCKARVGLNNCFPKTLLIELSTEEQLQLLNQDENEVNEDMETENELIEENRRDTEIDEDKEMEDIDIDVHNITEKVQVKEEVRIDEFQIEKVVHIKEEVQVKEEVHVQVE